ncbi:MAG: response regulator, partial [Oligoflexales bacterium]|nr:response regulator [Oligoflexales bacterium]
IFSQVDDSAIREYEGTGLGLALVKELTSAMDGDVFVESSPGHGALFGIKFKKLGDEADADTPAPDPAAYKPKNWHLGDISAVAPSSDQRDDEKLDGEGKLILIIDDLKDMRDLIARSLMSKGYRYTTASDGEEGYHKIIELKPDLAIIDWMMPKMSGPQIIEKMMTSTDTTVRSIPTVLLTAKSDEESRMTGIKKGAHAYLGKPFDQLELLSTIENLLHLKEGEDKIKELNRNLTENVLKRFLPHKLVNDIVSGEKVLDDKPKLMEITILFADLINFTDKSEDLGAYVIAGVLNEYFDRMTKVVFENDGTIDKFIGDGIMVIFGAPEIQSGETQVKNAIGCARAMQEVMKELNIGWKSKNNIEFAMRIGIHKGSGIVGAFGGERFEYTVIGPVVNMASRIEKSASPGAVYFSGAVRDILKEGWSRVDTFDLKGIGKTPLFKLNDFGDDRTNKAA